MIGQGGTSLSSIQSDKGLYGSELALSKQQGDTFDLGLFQGILDDAAQSVSVIDLKSAPDTFEVAQMTYGSHLEIEGRGKTLKGRFNQDGKAMTQTYLKPEDLLSVANLVSIKNLNFDGGYVSNVSLDTTQEVGALIVADRVFMDNVTIKNHARYNGVELEVLGRTNAAMVIRPTQFAEIKNFTLESAVGCEGLVVELENEEAVVIIENFQSPSLIASGKTPISVFGKGHAIIRGGGVRPENGMGTSLTNILCWHVEASHLTLSGAVNAAGTGGSKGFDTSEGFLQGKTNTLRHITVDETFSDGIAVCAEFIFATMIETSRSVSGYRTQLFNTFTMSSGYDTTGWLTEGDKPTFEVMSGYKSQRHTGKASAENAHHKILGRDGHDMAYAGDLSGYNCTWSGDVVEADMTDFGLYFDRAGVNAAAKFYNSEMSDFTRAAIGIEGDMKALKIENVRIEYLAGDACAVSISSGGTLGLLKIESGFETVGRHGLDKRDIVINEGCKVAHLIVENGVNVTAMGYVDRIDWPEGEGAREDLARGFFTLTGFNRLIIAGLGDLDRVSTSTDWVQGGVAGNRHIELIAPETMSVGSERRIYSRETVPYAGEGAATLDFNIVSSVQGGAVVFARAYVVAYNAAGEFLGQSGHASIATSAAGEEIPRSLTWDALPAGTARVGWAILQIATLGAGENVQIKDFVVTPHFAET